MRTRVFILLVLAGAVRGPAPIELPRNPGAFPARLSETHVFDHLESHPSLVPYSVNVSFYSDGASKRRWVLLPPKTKIKFEAEKPWKFPAGTLFVKHFEREEGGDRRPLETRLLLRDETASGVFGATYRWREDGSDADLVTATVAERGHTYLSPQDCRSCHTDSAGGVLGVNTRQLRSEGGKIGLSELFEKPPESVEGLPRITTAATAPLAIRVRSYLDANCAHCHNSSGSTLGDFDARFSNAGLLEQLVTARVHINLGVDHARLVAPRDHWRSVLLTRMTATDQLKMPPVGHNRPDPEGVALVEAYVQSLAGQAVLAPPRLVPAGGEFSSALEVTLSHADPLVTIHYTLDGSPPTTRSALYGGPIVLDRSATVRARAVKAGATSSVVAQDTYIVMPP